VKPLIYGYTRSPHTLADAETARLDLAAGVRGAVVHALDEVAGFEPGRTAAQPLTTDGETHGEAR
jgi:hypothetical protein